jgi:CDP-diacylglycerol---glycerol-3-phosphate 3-phosphatidyltransferase
MAAFAMDDILPNRSSSLTPMFDGSFRRPIEKAIRPVGNALQRTGLSPDHLTVVGLLVGIGAAIAIGSGHLLLGLVLVVLAAVPDLLDGALAKASEAASQRGAFFDSTVDRVTDAVLLGGVAWYLAGHESPHMSVLAFAVMAASSLISYQRAKAESLGLDAKGGLMERAERVVLLCIGLLWDRLLVPVLWIMLALTVLTAVQRFIKVWRQAEVAPVTAARIELRRNRRQTRRVARIQRRRTRVQRRRG